MSSDIRVDMTDYILADDISRIMATRDINSFELVANDIFSRYTEDLPSSMLELLDDIDIIDASKSGLSDIGDRGIFKYEVHRCNDIHSISIKDAIILIDSSDYDIVNILPGVLFKSGKLRYSFLVQSTSVDIYDHNKLTDSIDINDSLVYYGRNPKDTSKNELAKARLAYAASKVNLLMIIVALKVANLHEIISSNQADLDNQANDDYNYDDRD